MSFMPNVGTQVRLTDGRTAWVISFTSKHGEDDRVVFEDGHQEPVDVMYGIAEIIGEEMPEVVWTALARSAAKEGGGEEDPVVHPQPLSRRTVQAQVTYVQGRPKFHYDPLPEDEAGEGEWT